MSFLYVHDINNLVDLRQQKFDMNYCLCSFVDWKKECNIRSKLILFFFLRNRKCNCFWWIIDKRQFKDRAVCFDSKGVAVTVCSLIILCFDGEKCICLLAVCRGGQVGLWRQEREEKLCYLYYVLWPQKSKT